MRSLTSLFASRSLARFFATLAILVACACTTVMNWRFSYQLGTTPADSITWAIFSVALDVVKWLILPVAVLAWTNHKLRATAAFIIWIVATIYSFTAALGFAANNRDTTTAARHQQVDLRKTLATMKQSPRWQSSSACADANSSQDKQFCANYRAAAVGIQSPAEEADAQSALLSRLSGLQPETVRLLLSIFLATACEVISALGFFALLPPSPPATKSLPKTWRPLTRPDIAAPGRAATRSDMLEHDMPRPTQTWKNPR